MSSDNPNNNKLRPAEGMLFESEKTYTHAQGLSCCFRQWRAKSHCQFLHGYSLQITITFRHSQGLDDNNWVMDFGGLKKVKQWLEETFDHKTLIAADDPKLIEISELSVVDLVVVEHVGCEAFAKMIYDHVMWQLTQDHIPYVFVECVEVREHQGNAARYRRL